MARTILLVEPDLDTLGQLGSRLRSLGLTVFLADSTVSAWDRLCGTRADAVLLSHSLGDLPEFLLRLSKDRDLASTPCFVLVNSERWEEPNDLVFGVERLPQDEPDLIARQLHSLPSKPPQLPPLRDDFRGDLQQVSIVDLLQLLSMNRRTGALGIVTAAGAGEVRLSEGEVVDAVYRRLEGEKALFRLLAETEGNFAFTSQTLPSATRISTPGPLLLLEGLRQLDEARQLKRDLGLDDDAVLAVGSGMAESGVEAAPGDSTAPTRPGESEVVQRLWIALAAPHTLDEVLDELPFSDLEILRALEILLESAAVRRIPKGQIRAPLANPEGLAVLGALVARLKPSGYSGPVRLAVAARARRLRTVMHAAQRLADAVAPVEGPPTLPTPFPMATLRVGESAELTIVGLPLVIAYSPLWCLALPGTAAVIRLENTEAPVLEQICGVWGIPLLDAAALVGQIDETDPAHLALLFRLTLEGVASE